MASLSALPEVEPLRRASRQVVRELGFLDGHPPSHGLTTSQCHALIEIGQEGQLTTGELAHLLNLDKSTLSRRVQPLVEAGLLAAKEDPGDRRRRPLTLTQQGRQRLARVHEDASRHVRDALQLLNEAERRAVVDGMALYAKALSRLRARASFRIRPIRREDDPEMARVMRTVMASFGAVGPGYSINDPEMDDMTKSYTGSRTRFYVVVRGRRIVGGGGIAPLANGPGDVCELRKMYYLPEARGLGLGKEVLTRLLKDAAEMRYRKCYLETLERMSDARRLYESFGFKPLTSPMGCTGHRSCDAWYAKELGGEGGAARAGLEE